MDAGVVATSVGVLAGLLNVGALILLYYTFHNLLFCKKPNQGAAWGCWAGFTVIYIIDWFIIGSLAPLMMFISFVWVLTTIGIISLGCGSGGSCCGCGSCCSSKKKRKYYSESYSSYSRNSSVASGGRPGVMYGIPTGSSSSSSDC